MLGARSGNLGPLRRRFCDFYVRSHFFALFLAFASRESVLDVRVGGYNFGAILVGPICLGCNTKTAHPGPYFLDLLSMVPWACVYIRVGHHGGVPRQYIEQRFQVGHQDIGRCRLAATVISDPRFGGGISRLSPRYSVYSEEYRGAKGNTTELTPVEL